MHGYKLEQNAPFFGFHELLDEFRDYVSLSIKHNEITKDNYTSSETKNQLIQSFSKIYHITTMAEWFVQTLRNQYDYIVAWHFDNVIEAKSLHCKLSTDGTHYEDWRRLRYDEGYAIVERIVENMIEDSEIDASNVRDKETINRMMKRLIDFHEKHRLVYEVDGLKRKLKDALSCEFGWEFVEKKPLCK